MRFKDSACSGFSSDGTARTSKNWKEVQDEPEAQPKSEAEATPEALPEASAEDKPAAATNTTKPPKENIQEERSPDTTTDTDAAWNHDFDEFPNYEGEKEGMGFDPNEGEYFEVPQPVNGGNPSDLVLAEHGITREEFAASDPTKYHYIDFSKYSRDEEADRILLDSICTHVDFFISDPRNFDEYSYLFLKYPEYLDPEKYPELFEKCPRFYELIG